MKTATEEQSFKNVLKQEILLKNAKNFSIINHLENKFEPFKGKKLGALYEIVNPLRNPGARHIPKNAPALYNLMDTVQIPMGTPVMYLGHNKKMGVARILYNEKICFLHENWLSKKPVQ